MVWATSKASDQPARMRSLIRAFASEATDQTSLEFLSLKGGCIGLYESTLVKMPHCLESHVAAHMFSLCFKAAPSGTFATEATTERQR